MVSEVSSLETNPWPRRSIARSNSGVEFKSCWSSEIWLVTTERGKSCDIISFVKLKWLSARDFSELSMISLKVYEQDNFFSNAVLVYFLLFAYDVIKI